jgi:hypothetical protein
MRALLPHARVGSTHHNSSFFPATSSCALAMYSCVARAREGGER